MSDTSTKRALEVAKFHDVSEELYADNQEKSGLRAMHHISANLIRALAAERDVLRAALQWLVNDLQDYPASARPIAAYDNALEVLGEKE